MDFNEVIEANLKKIDKICVAIDIKYDKNDFMKYLFDKNISADDMAIEFLKFLLNQLAGKIYDDSISGNNSDNVIKFTLALNRYKRLLIAKYSEKLKCLTIKDFI